MFTRLAVVLTVLAIAKAIDLENQCDSSPCENSATCVDGYNSFACVCHAGFSGPHCQVNEDECQSNPCMHGATCTDDRDADTSEGDLMDTFYCECVEGYTGHDCEFNTNECESSPCQNGMKCQATRHTAIGDSSGYSFVEAWETTGDYGNLASPLTPTSTTWTNPFGDESKGHPALGLNTDSWQNMFPEVNYVEWDDYTGFQVTTESTWYDLSTFESSGDFYSEYQPYHAYSTVYTDFGPDAYVCDCAAGYEGHNCEVNIDECSSDPCSNGATCINLEIGHTYYPAGEITIRPYIYGYGDDCENGEFECYLFDVTDEPTGEYMNVFEEDGQTKITLEDGESYDASIDTNTGYLSVNIPDGAMYTENMDYLNVFFDVDGNLLTGFQGEVVGDGYNQTWIDENGYDAEEIADAMYSYRYVVSPPRPYIAPGWVADTYMCECVIGFGGHDCEVNLNECLSSPCLNGGICSDETSLANGNVCDESLCVASNGNPDNDLENSGDWCGGCDDDYLNNLLNDDTVHYTDWHCTCPPGYLGEVCEINTLECDSNPCDNFATCEDRINDYFCHCPDAWTGKNCSDSVDDCVDVDCGDGTCVDHHGFYSCVCDDGYEDSDDGPCSSETENECESIPCLNGGTCVDLSYNEFQPFDSVGSAGFKCNCPNGFGGDTCSTFWEYSSIMDFGEEEDIKCREPNNEAEKITVTLPINIESKCYNPAPSDVKMYFFFMDDEDSFSHLSNTEFDSLNFRVSDDPDFQRSKPTCSIASSLPSGNYHRSEQHLMDYATLSGSPTFTPTSLPTFRSTTSEGGTINNIVVDETASGNSMADTQYGDPVGIASRNVDTGTWTGKGSFTDDPQQQITFGETWELYKNLYGWYGTSDAIWTQSSITTGGATVPTEGHEVSSTTSNSFSGVYPMDSSGATTDESQSFLQSPYNEGLSLIVCDMPSGYSSTVGLDGLFLHEDDCNSADKVTCSAQEWWVNIQGAKYWDYGWQYYRPWAVPEGFYTADGSSAGDFYDMQPKNFFRSAAGPEDIYNGYLPFLYAGVHSSGIGNIFGDGPGDTNTEDNDNVWQQNFGQMFPTQFTVKDCPTDTSVVEKTVYLEMDIDSADLAAKLDTVHSFMWFSMDEEKTGFAHPEVEDEKTFTTFTQSDESFVRIYDPAEFLVSWDAYSGLDVCQYYHEHGDYDEDYEDLSCDWTEFYACPNDDASNRVETDDNGEESRVMIPKSSHPSPYAGSRGWAEADGVENYYNAQDYFCCCESNRTYSGFADGDPFPLTGYQGAWDRLFGGVRSSVSSDFTIHDGATVEGMSWHSYDSYDQGVQGNQNVRFIPPNERRQLDATEDPTASWFTNPQFTPDYKSWYLGTRGRSAVDFLYDNAFKYIQYFFDENPNTCKDDPDCYGNYQGFSFSEAQNYIPASMNNLYATGTIGIYAGLTEEYTLPVIGRDVKSWFDECDSGNPDGIYTLTASTYSWAKDLSLVISEVPVEVETDASEMASLINGVEKDIADALGVQCEEPKCSVRVTDVSEYQYHDEIIDPVAYNTFEDPMAFFGQANQNERRNRRHLSGITSIRKASTYNDFWVTAQSIYLSAGAGMSTRCDEAQAGYDGLSGRPEPFQLCDDHYNSWYPWLVYVKESGTENYATWSTSKNRWKTSPTMEKPTCSRGVTSCNRYLITFDVNVIQSNAYTGYADEYAVEDALLLQLENPSSVLRQASRTRYVDVSAGLNGWTACEEEPCLNGGTCLAVGQDMYTCACNTTSHFAGPNCGEQWDSTPDQINARFAYYTHVTGTSAVLQWDEPGLGTWDWPVRGYRIRSNAADFFCDVDADDDCTCEEVDGVSWCELTGIYSPDVDSLDYDLDVTESDVCEDESCSPIYGLSPGTDYQFQIIAYNLDGDSENWSDAVYTLHTHAVPNMPAAPVEMSNDDTTVTVSLTYPKTVGTNDCEALSLGEHLVHFIEDKNINGEHCTTDGSGSDVDTYTLQYADCGDDDCATTDVEFQDVIVAEDGTLVLEAVVEVGESQAYTFEGLSPSTYYRFRYSATNAVGTSEPSPYVVIKTYTVPATPSACDYVAVSDSSITLSCTVPANGGVEIDGIRLFGQSSDDNDNWSPATRYTLTSSEQQYYYESNPMDSILPPGMEDWLEIDATDAQLGAETVVFQVEMLSHDTEYKFSIIFFNRVGDSSASVSSVPMRTLEAKITTVEAFTGAPCIYQDADSTIFRAVSDGTNANYKWEIIDGSVIAEGGQDNCENDSCSQMEYEFSDLGEHNIRLIAYNTRGMRAVDITVEVAYCGCTDIYDANYWEHATYHLPYECEDMESWLGADKDLLAGEEMIYQTYYDESVIEMELIVRVDVGSVNVYWSTWQFPDPDLRVTYADKALGVTAFARIQIPYEDLYGSQTLYVKVVGDATDSVSFSRFEVVAHQSTFSSLTHTREMLEDQVGVTVDDLKTGYSNFYEYFFSFADSDVDVEIITTVHQGCVDVHTSLEERFPDTRRATTDSSGYLYNAAMVCATDPTPTESIMHTIKSWEGSAIADSIDETAAFRGLFVSVLGMSEYDLGDEQAVNEYTIEAKIYRYRIDSSLMNFADDDSAHIVTDVEGVGRTIEEDYRYSVVMQDNFNYYQLQLSDTGYAFEVEIVEVYGEIDVYTSRSKLPTLDTNIGHDDMKAYCDTTDCSFECTDPAKKCYKFTIGYNEYNQEGNYIYLGIFGKESDSSYKIIVTEKAFSVSSITEVANGDPQTVEISPTDQFYEIYVGDKDTDMYVTSRSGPGSRTHDLGADQNTWGIDWTEPLTQTWIEQHMDDYDLDVDVFITASGLSDLPNDTYFVYASGKEKYPSAERGSEVSTKLVKSTDSMYICDGNIDGACDVPFDGSSPLISIPHFTFSSRMVYFSILSSTETGTATLTFNIEEKLPGSVTQDGDSFYADDVSVECPMTDRGPCDLHGSCVKSDSMEEAICMCDDGYLGDACGVQAFSSETGSPQVSLTPYNSISNTAGPDIADFYTSEGGTYTLCYSGVPQDSFVLLYLDGAAYPSKMNNIIFLYTDSDGSCNDPRDPEKYDVHNDADGCSVCGTTIEIYGQTEIEVDHTIEVILLSDTSVALDTSMKSFRMLNDNFCIDNCSGKGICHEGYCVCFDGYGGTSCQHDDVNEDGFVDDTGDLVVEQPGQGYVDYIQMQNEQTEKMAQYENTIALTKNEYIISRSDEELEVAAARVKETINEERSQLQVTMTQLSEDLETDIHTLELKREQLEIAVQQMREESNRLQTKNAEKYIDFQRDMNEYMTDMQNRLDSDLKAHYEVMAQKADDWEEVKAELKFELNQLKTANGPLVDIADLKETKCTQNEFYEVSCESIDASEKFETYDGYISHGDPEEYDVNGEWVGGAYEVEGAFVEGAYDYVPR